jgi:DNA polymerase I-like protein with 3'-5' exonuclease and polymerase domains
VCKSCGAVDVAKSHACAPKVKGVLELQQRTVTRYFIREKFLPSSHTQVLDYITYRKHKAGKAKKTKKPTTDKKTLDRLVKSTKDPVYRLILDHRAVAKVLGTYVNGSLLRLDKNNRLHPTFTWKPSTLRSSCVNPNIQNVVTDRG